MARGHQLPDTVTSDIAGTSNDENIHGQGSRDAAMDVMGKMEKWRRAGVKDGKPLKE
jgi:hypothetical protein